MQADPADVEREQRSELIEGHRAEAVVGVGRVAGPDQTDLEASAGRRVQAAGEFGCQSGVDRKRCRAGRQLFRRVEAKVQGQRQQVNPVVESEMARSRSMHGLESGQSGKQFGDAGRDQHLDFACLGGNQRQQRGKLDLVAQALFADHEQALAAQVFAAPHRPLRFVHDCPGGFVRAFVTAFEKRPGGAVAAGVEQGQREIPANVRGVLAEFAGAAQELLGRGQLAGLAQDNAFRRNACRALGRSLQGRGLTKGMRRLGKMAELLQGDAAIVLGDRIARIAPADFGKNGMCRLDGPAADQRRTQAEQRFVRQGQGGQPVTDKAFRGFQMGQAFQQGLDGLKHGLRGLLGLLHR